MSELQNQQSSFTAEGEKLKIASLDILSLNKTSLFTKEECETMLAGCIEDLWLPVKVVGEKGLHSSTRQKVRGEVEGFPFAHIKNVTKNANDEVYDFKLLGIIDQDFPQIFKYEKDDHYEWHMDLTPMAPTRKLTFVINLSDPSTYEGGNIEFLNIDADPGMLNEQGSCLIFPSWTTYKINPVISGKKHVLVGHVHGSLFR